VRLHFNSFPMACKAYIASSTAHPSQLTRWREANEVPFAVVRSPSSPKTKTPQTQLSRGTLVRTASPRSLFHP
jgi:hypothetical protein